MSGHIFDQISTTERRIYLIGNFLMVVLFVLSYNPDFQRFIMDIQLDKIPENCEVVRYVTGLEGLTYVTCESIPYDKLSIMKY